jgi:hypothetical protein
MIEVTFAKFLSFSRKNVMGNSKKNVKIRKIQKKIV